MTNVNNEVTTEVLEETEVNGGVIKSIDERASEIVQENTEAQDEYTVVNNINKAQMMANTAMNEAAMLQETKNQIREINFTDTDMDSMEESLLNDGALKLMQDPGLWTFDDIKKHFTDENGDLVEVELDMDEERKKEYILDYARLVYTNHYAMKNAERITEQFQKDSLEANEEIAAAIRELDMQSMVYNGVTDVNSTFMALLEKEIEKLRESDLTDAKAKELDNITFMLQETNKADIDHIVEFIKSRTSRQILNTYKKNSKSIVGYFHARIKDIGMTLDNAKWKQFIQDFEVELFPGEKIGKVGNVFVFILAYYCYNKKDVWLHVDTIILRRLMNDLIFLFDTGIELTEEHLERKEILVAGIREVLENTSAVIEKAGHDYVKVFN